MYYFTINTFEIHKKKVPAPEITHRLTQFLRGSVYYVSQYDTLTSRNLLYPTKCVCTKSKFECVVISTVI